MPKKKQQTEDSDDHEDDSENQRVKIQLNRPKIDRILKDSINLKKIIINVSMTQYPVVTQVAEQLNWKVQTDAQAGDWDIFWTDFSIQPDILIRMHFHQKINHFPGIYVIARKNLLGLNLMSMRNKFPDQYNFFPLTWMLPSQYSQFRMYYQSVTKGKVRTYIVKPQAQCQGRGIFLTRNIEDLENGSHYVIQRYVTKPYLIDGLKFDLRIYVLLSGSNPLRVYLYQEGLARFATEPYVQPNSSNLDQTFIHLTNYAINKFNPKFIFNKGVNDMSTGHKRSLTSVYKLLQKKGQNVRQLKNKIKDIIIKTLLTSNPLIGHQYKCSQPQQYFGNMCFHILGFDILITDAFQPLLLEVNHTPSFTTDTPLDTHIKHNLIKDTLILMNINPKTKANLYKKAKKCNHQRLLTGKRQIFQGQLKDKEVEKAQYQRDEYQNKHLGGFQRIHPTQDVQRKQKYIDILQYATKCYHQQNSLRVKMQEREAKKMMKQEIKLYKQKKQKIYKPVQTQKSLQSKPRPNKKFLTKSTINEVKSNQNKYVKTSQISNSQTTINQASTIKPKKPSNDITQIIRLTKESVRQNIIGSQDKKLLSIYEKSCRTKIQLPHLPIDERQAGLLLSQTDLIQNKKQLIDKQLEALNFKRSMQIIDAPTKNYDTKVRISKVKKVLEEGPYFVKGSNKTGNFVMPKIFDLNVNVQQNRQHQLTFLKINTFSKHNYDQ